MAGNRKGTPAGAAKGAGAFRVYIEGIPELVSNLSKFEDNLVDGVVAATEVAQARIVNSARRTVPVKTGALQNSIGAGRIEVTNTKVRGEVVAAMNYATYVEKRKPYLGPALLANERGYVASIAQVFKRAVKV